MKTTPEGEWIVLYYAFPTRLDEARFPTKAELDEVAPKHPVLYHAGPAGIANTQALKAGYNYGETVEMLPVQYQVAKAQISPGTYRKITGNDAAVPEIITAARASVSRLAPV